MAKEHQKHANQIITDNLLIRGKEHVHAFCLINRQ